MIREKRNRRLPLWGQLLILLTLLMTVTITFMLGRDYRKTSETIRGNYMESSGQVLHLELQNLQQFIKDLALYSLQPRYDTTFLGLMMNRSEELSEENRNYILDQIRSFYYSRTDITSYELYMSNKGISFGRNRSSQHFTQYDNTDMPDEKGFGICADNKYYNAIMPPEGGQDFLQYYQAIIRIDTGKPLAVAKVGVSKKYPRTLTQTHSERQEKIAILNRDGELLYTDLTPIREKLQLLEEKNAYKHVYGDTWRIGDEDYLVAADTEEAYGLTLISMLPVSVIEAQLRDIRYTNLSFGLMAWLFTSILLFVIIKFTTKPLTLLSNRMKTVGSGDFLPLQVKGGSRETAELTDNFNDMLCQIQNLIEQNYISQINEKTSRLAALEAQLNPHYLYNTLQAIGTEALINDQPQINRMITSLASNLRYTIKGGDLVPLSQEMRYVRNYLLLQKMRLEDRLTVVIDMEESEKDPLIPKISIQTLIENAIIHGMGNGNNAIRIEVEIRIGETQLLIEVRDDGCGISPQQLSLMLEEFQQFMKPTNVGKIGLINLNSRLHILYQGRADMTITSEVGSGTKIGLRIPICLEEGETNVQSPDHR